MQNALNEHSNIIFYEFFVFQGKAKSLSVEGFLGEESVDKLYEITVFCRVHAKDIELNMLVKKRALFTVRSHSCSTEKKFNGIIARVRVINRALSGELSLEIKLVPQVWMLSLETNSRFFCKRSIPEIISDLLNRKRKELHGFNFKFKLSRSYRKKNIICQYKESDLDFMYRVMRQAGIFFYFEQNRTQEIITFVDNFSHKFWFHNTVSDGLVYPRSEVLEWEISRKIVPKTLKVRGYKKNSHEDIDHSVIVDETGFGHKFVYDPTLQSFNDVVSTCEIISEQLRCEKVRYKAKTNSPFLSAGRHFQPNSAKEFFITNVKHFSEKISGENGGCSYSNQVFGVEINAPYRPKFLDGKIPEVQESVLATVKNFAPTKSANSNVEHYCVVFDFDKEKQAVPVKRSIASKNIGAPLKQNTRVLIKFINSSPHNPVIVGVLSNEKNAILKNSNSTNDSVISNQNGQKIHFQENEQKEIKFHCGQSIYGNNGVQEGGTVIKMSENKLTYKSHNYLTFVYAPFLQLTLGTMDFISTEAQTVSTVSAIFCFNFDWHLIGGAAAILACLAINDTMYHSKKFNVSMHLCVDNKSRLSNISNNIAKKSCEESRESVRVSNDQTQLTRGRIETSQSSLECHQRVMVHGVDRGEEGQAGMNIVTNRVDQADASVKKYSVSQEESNYVRQHGFFSSQSAEITMMPG